VREHVFKRVLAVGAHIADHGATVRDAARAFGVSKSTVHKDLTERLPLVNPGLARRVRDVLAYNRSQRHLRGGDATRRKYALRSWSPGG
jgi:putative DeoR family transcriptional regulator (stage III sporulation protein D)